MPIREGQPVRVKMQLHVLTGAHEALDIAAHRKCAEKPGMHGLDKKRCGY